MSRCLNRTLLIWIIFLPLLSACGLLSKSLVPDSSLFLLDPEFGPEQAVLQQKVTIVRKGESKTFVVITKLSPDIMQVVVLMPAGQRVLTMKYDGQAFEFTNYTDVKIPAQEIFSLMQFAMWPEKILDIYYGPQSGWQTEFSTQQRQLLKWQQPVLQVLFKANQTEVHHLRHEYQVIIEPLESRK